MVWPRRKVSWRRYSPSMGLVRTIKASSLMSSIQYSGIPAFAYSLFIICRANGGDLCSWEIVYEEYYGFTESPFSLTPDPKFFYFGASQIRAYELLRYGIYRGEGFMSLVGNIGTGKTTLWRTLFANAEQNLFTALLLNPF